MVLGSKVLLSDGAETGLTARVDLASVGFVRVVDPILAARLLSGIIFTRFPIILDVTSTEKEHFPGVIT